MSQGSIGMQDLSLLAKGEVKLEGSAVISGVSNGIQSVVKGSRMGDEVFKCAKEFTTCEMNTDRTLDILKRMFILVEEMEFNRICILKSLSKSQALIGQIDNINESVSKRTQSH